MNKQVMYAAGSSVIANDNSNQIISGVVVGHWESKKKPAIADTSLMQKMGDSCFLLIGSRWLAFDP